MNLSARGQDHLGNQGHQPDIPEAASRSHGAQWPGVEWKKQDL